MCGYYSAFLVYEDPTRQWPTALWGCSATQLVRSGARAPPRWWVTPPGTSPEVPLGGQWPGTRCPFGSSWICRGCSGHVCVLTTSSRAWLPLSGHLVSRRWKGKVRPPYTHTHTLQSESDLGWLPKPALREDLPPEQTEHTSPQLHQESTISFRLITLHLGQPTLHHQGIIYRDKAYNLARTSTPSSCWPEMVVMAAQGKSLHSWPDNDLAHVWSLCGPQARAGVWPVGDLGLPGDHQVSVQESVLCS